MIPAPHPGVTRRFGAPADWSPKLNGECGVLEVAELVDGHLPWMESLWRPDAEEIAALKDGGVVTLRIQGQVHPVVSVGVRLP